MSRNRNIYFPPQFVADENQLYDDNGMRKTLAYTIEDSNAKANDLRFISVLRCYGKNSLYNCK